MRRVERTMRQSVSIALASILLAHSALEAKVRAREPGAAPQTTTSGKPTLKEKILDLPPGTLVEVRLKGKQKLRGRIGEVSDEGFALQSAKANKIETQKISFEEVKSIKKAKEAFIIGEGLVGLIVVGTVVLVAILIAVASAA